MRQIVPPIPNVAKLCGPQTAHPGEYRFSTYCMPLDCPDGRLLYHTLTGELLLLAPGEGADRNRDELIRRRFLVPAAFDDAQYLAQVRQLISLLTKNDGLNSFLIFTTLDCNARCYYCYELGGARPSMSAETARDVAAYILQNRGQGDVKLQFFGGEPLFNRPAIDIITAALRDNGVAFHATMVSNGYLFDEETVQTARERWNLRQVQITLDGTEEVYNRSKAYIYREGSPYRRVLGNIGLLLEAGIRVVIRLNLGRDNAADLLAVSEELARRFPEKRNLRVYAALLKDYGNVKMDLGDAEARIAAYRTLCLRLRELGLSATGVQRRFSGNHCLADNAMGIGILPDGRITRCEHETDEKAFGSITVPLPARDELKKWAARVSVPECAGCVHAPLCTELKKCPGSDGTCTALDRMIKDMRLRDSVLQTYENEKNRAASASSEKEETETPALC